jgi:hypothetical protein
MCTLRPLAVMPRRCKEPSWLRILVPMSPLGTKRISRAGLMMSVVQGKAGVGFQGRQVAF